ncbi:MAG: YtxH domain-containing protein [Cytophagaceae bacterium]
MKQKGMVIGALLLGVAAGGVLGILFAPQKGSKTRKTISDKGDDLLEDMTGKFNHLLEDMKREVESVKNKASAFIENAALKR